MANIQWYPGHMAKAIHQIQDNLHLVDIVFELVDARIPVASRNPEIEKTVQQKPHLLIMTKKDLADPQATADWVKYYEDQGQVAIAVDSRSRTIGKQMTQAASDMLADKLAKIAARGITNRPIRAVCVGIPNVGKSTLLNHIVNKKIAKVGDRALPRANSGSKRPINWNYSTPQGFYGRSLKTKSLVPSWPSRVRLRKISILTMTSLCLPWTSSSSTTRHA